LLVVLVVVMVMVVRGGPPEFRGVNGVSNNYCHGEGPAARQLEA
jgi:hypothetical protein